MAATGGDEVDEWEYEYDENETEDFYVILELPPTDALKPKSRIDDLFAAHDPLKSGKSLKVNRKAGKKRTRKDVEADENEDEDEAEEPDRTQSNEPKDTDTTILPSIEALNLTGPAEKDEQPLDVKPSLLQFMDLESENPMILYQDQLFSCNWASGIGSDLLFIKRPDEPDADYQPLRSFKDVDLLAIGSAKLVASLATVERKSDDGKVPEDVAGSATERNGTSVPSTAHSDDVLRQANFLGRMAEIRAKRGEPVGNLKSLSESVYMRSDAPEQDAVISSIRGARGRRGSRAGASTGRARGRQTPASQRTEVGGPARGAETSTPTPASWDGSPAANGE